MRPTTVRRKRDIFYDGSVGGGLTRRWEMAGHTHVTGWPRMAVTPPTPTWSVTDGVASARRARRGGRGFDEAHRSSGTSMSTRLARTRVMPTNQRSETDLSEPYNDWAPGLYR